MTIRMTMIGATLALALAGCHGGATGGGGAASGIMPAQFVGNWGADCMAPYVKFGADTMHDYPGNADYPLKAAALDGGQLKVTYTRPDGEVTDTYASDGTTLTLTKTVAANGGEADWHKAPMSKCK